MFSLKLFACIFSLAVNVNGENDQNNQNFTSCIENLNKCELMNFSDILPIDEDGYSLNLTTASNDNLCRLASQVMSCMRSVSDIPGCVAYAESVVLPFDVVNALSSQLCHGQGRIDLDAVASCTNNKFIQRHYYGEVKEIRGFVRGMEECLYQAEGQSRNSQLRWRELVCRAIQRMFRHLPRLMMRVCGPNASAAVKRVMEVLYPQQNHLVKRLHLSDECRFITLDMFIEPSETNN